MNNVKGFEQLIAIYRQYYMPSETKIKETPTQAIKNLQIKTGVGLLECKQALQHAHWDFDLAFEHLKNKGVVKVVEDRYTRRSNEYKKQFQPNIFLGGWIFVKPDFVTTVEYLANAIFYIPISDDENEQIADSDKYVPWLEFQTFVDIIDNKLTHHPLASHLELKEAIIYYYTFDTFLD